LQNRTGHELGQAILGDYMWKDILKYKMIPPELMQAKANLERKKYGRNKKIQYGVSGYERFDFQEFVNEWNSIRPTPFISERAYNYLLNMEPDAKDTFLEMPIPSYEEYKKMYSFRQEEADKDAELDEELMRIRQEKRRERDTKMRERRSPEYYRQTLPQPLRTQDPEEE
jgi:hypothetical protein